ncbi:hypothetical protein ACHAXS_011770, partial [Conticribra weissflogii]
MPCGEFQYARVLVLHYERQFKLPIEARFAPTSAGVLSKASMLASDP